MYKTLEELNAEEFRLMKKVTAIKGTIEEQIEEIEKTGVFSDYRKVHKAYIELIKHGTEPQKREALKRALFIQWYGLSEPPFNTGINYETVDFESDGLAWEDIIFVNSELDSLLSKNVIDDELYAMLSYYITWDYIFQFRDFLKFKNLQKFVKERGQSNENHVLKVRKFNLADRGQMGEYWLSLNL